MPATTANKQGSIASQQTAAKDESSVKSLIASEQNSAKIDANLIILDSQLGSRSLTVQLGGLFHSDVTIFATNLAVIRIGVEINLTPKLGPRLPLSVEDRINSTSSTGEPRHITYIHVGRSVGPTDFEIYLFLPACLKQKRGCVDNELLMRLWIDGFIGPAINKGTKGCLYSTLYTRCDDMVSAIEQSFDKPGNPVYVLLLEQKVKPCWERVEMQLKSSSGSFKDAFLVLAMIDKDVAGGNTFEEGCAGLSKKLDSCIDSRYLMPDPGSVHAKFECHASFNSDGEAKEVGEKGVKRKFELDEEEIELIEIVRKVKKAKARKALAKEKVHSPPVV